jgi:hypothetical protein
LIGLVYQGSDIMTRIVILGILGMLLTQSGGVLPARETEKKSEEKVLIPLVISSGWKTKIDKTLYCRVESDKAWKTLYQEHEFGKADPAEDMDWKKPQFDVDFNRCMVLAIVRASDKGEFVLHSFKELEGQLLVRFMSLHYMTGVASFPNQKPKLIRCGPDGPQGEWAFIVLPRSKKSVLFEEGYRQESSDSLTWHSRAELKEGDARIERDPPK